MSVKYSMVIINWLAWLRYNHSCSGPWGGCVRGPWEKGRHFGSRETGPPKWGQWASVEPRHGFRMRACTEWVNVHSQQDESVNILSSIVLIALLFQENNSFGASTICIHPLMYVKPWQEQLRHFGSLGSLIFAMASFPAIMQSFWPHYGGFYYLWEKWHFTRGGHGFHLIMKPCLPLILYI